MRSPPRRELALAVALVFLAVSSGCAGLFGDEEPPDLEWQTAAAPPGTSSTPGTPTATSTPTPTVDVAALTNTHQERLANASYRLRTDVVVRQNDTVVGNATVELSHEPGRVQYRYVDHGSPVPVLGIRSFLGIEVRRFAAYGVEDRVYAKAEGTNRSTVLRLRDYDANSAQGWATTESVLTWADPTRERLLILLSAVPEDGWTVEGLGDDDRGLTTGPHELETPIDFRSTTVIAIESGSLTVFNGVIVRYELTYIVRDDDERYTVVERGRVEEPGRFSRPAWVPNGTATPG